MSQFESQSPLIGSSRRASSFPNIPRVGVNESLATPGIAISNPSSSGVLLAQELNHAITGIASVVSDLGNNAARQRQLTKAEEEKQQAKLKAAQDIIDAKDRSEATVHAQLDAEKVTHGLKMGLIQVNSDPAQFASQVVDSNTQGMSPVYAEAYRNHVTLAITKSFNDRSEALYNDSLKATLDTLPSSMLSMSNSADVHKLVESYQKIDPNMPVDSIIAKSVVPAAKAAAQAGRTDQVNMLLGTIPDETFGLEKREIQATLSATNTKIKTAQQTNYRNEFHRGLADLNTSPASLLSDLSKNAANLDGDEVLQLRNAAYAEQDRRTREAEKASKDARIDAYKQAAFSDATAKFASGTGWSIQPMTKDRFAEMQAASVPTKAVAPFEDKAKEQAFQTWYKGVAKQVGIDANPDAKEHQYDYRRAWEAGAGPDASQGNHWPSEFKLANHPNRYVDGADTITGGADKDLPTLTKDELESHAAQEIYKSHLAANPDNPQAAQALYIRDMARNAYKDPMLSGYLSTGGDLISRAMMDDTGKNAPNIDKEIVGRYDQYIFARGISPKYAKDLAGDSAMYYEAIEDVLQTKPAGGTAGAARVVADNARRNIAVELHQPERQSISDKVQSVTRPWFKGNAGNELEVVNQAERLSRGYMRLGIEPNAAITKSIDRIKETHSVINGWAVQTDDVRITPTVKSHLTDVLHDRLDQYIQKHPEDKAYVEDYNQWTMDFNPENGHFVITGKDPSVQLPTIDPSLSVISVDEMPALADSMAKKDIIGKFNSRSKPAAAQAASDAQVAQERFLSDKFGTFNKYLK